MSTRTDEATVHNFEVPAWEPIIPFSDIGTPEIPAEFLPTWVGEFVREISACAQTPEAFAVLLAYPTIAACVQQRFCVSPYADSYNEPVNVWTVGVMPPGSRKTFIQEQLTKPLVDWERERGESMKAEIAEAETARAITNKRIEKLQNDAAREADHTLRAATAREIAQLRESMPDEVRAPRLFTNDCTAERFQSLLVDYNERMAVLSDEGGIFEVMSGLYTQGQVNMDVFLKSHAGSAVRVDRNSRAAHLDHPLSTFGLAVQPSIIEDLTKGSKRKFSGNGCLARFLYTVPASNVGSRDLTKRQLISESVQQAYNLGIRGLLDIPAVIQDGVERSRVLHLEVEALRSWTAFQQALEARMNETGDLMAISDWTAKLPGAVLRLAALNHIIEHGINNPTISRGTIERTLDLADLLIQHALCAFSLMGADQATADAKYVTRWLKKNGARLVRQNEIYRVCHGKIARIDRLQKALAVLIERHIISDAIIEKTGGRPSIQFYVNPEILGGDQ